MYTYIYKARALPKRDTINFRLKWIFKMTNYCSLLFTPFWFAKDVI